MMAHFNSLPNEIIREILKLVQPEDLENFAQISPNVYSLASPFLREHRALIHKYHTLRNYSNSVDDIGTTLVTILANPCIGSYVRRVELGPLGEGFVYTREELEVFTAAALESICLKKPLEEEILDERAFWLDKLECGDENILLAILLPLLPNLAVLSVQDYSERLEWYHSAIEQAAFATKPTLCKLERVELKATGSAGYHIADIQKFVALPSVRELTAPNAHGMDCLHEMSLDLNSHVTHLKLWENRVDSRCLYEFLRAFPKLQSFTYAFHGICDLRDPFLIRSGLLAYCKAMLQYLTILCPNSNFTLFMGLLRSFETLKEVYTEWDFLITEDRKGSLWLNELFSLTLEGLKIHDSSGRKKNKYRKVIKSAQYAKEHRLQNLKWLIFGGARLRWSAEDIDWGMRKTCSNLGISLIFSPYAPESGD